MDAMSEYTFPEEGQDLEGLKYKDVAKNIAEQYITPLKLNENTRENFLDSLESKLETINKEHIDKTDKEEMQKIVRETYPKEHVDEILKNLEASWNSSSEEEDNLEEDQDSENTDADDFIYPKIGLAYSDTFFGFDDAGNLSYEEQEQRATEKFEQYKSKISEFLAQQPDQDLHPKGLDSENQKGDDVDWGRYYEFMDANPFAHEFDDHFTVWKGENKILFLSMQKEDKELPYEICIGGLSLDKYTEILTAYNGWVKSL